MTAIPGTAPPDIEPIEFEIRGKAWEFVPGAIRLWAIDPCLALTHTMAANRRGDLSDAERAARARGKRARESVKSDIRLDRGANR